MELFLDDVTTNDMQTSVASPRTIILHAGDHRREALLLAATEGATRFVTSAPGESEQQRNGIAAAVHLLSDQSGYTLTPDDIEAILLRGRPLRVSVVGAPGDDDWAALRDGEQSGAVRIVAAHEPPPRGGSRLIGWAEQTAEHINRGGCDVLVVALPPGDLPDWGAQLIAAVHGAAPHADRQLIVLAAGAGSAPALLPGATVLERNDALRQRLADRLARISATRLIPSFPADVHVLSSTAAVAAGVSFARRDSDETIVYLDLSEGCTVVVAHPAGVELLHDAACDLSSGAVALLHRHGADDVARWIPFPVDAAALRTWAVRRVAAPQALLVDPTDCAIASGFARAALRALVATATAQRPTRCIVGPTLLHSGLPAAALRAVADILPPSPNVAVEADADDLMPVVGYLALKSPDSARSLLDHDALAPLGTVMTFPARADRKAIGIAAVLTGADGSTRTATPQDALTAVAASAGTVRVIWRDGREEAIQVRGGPCGLLIDTRARPLRGVASGAETRSNVSNRLRTALAEEETERG